jgi:rhodanese-related sulfurtransferase
LLVCANEGEDRFRENQLAGAISLDTFRSQADVLPRDREIIFYCDCPHDELSTQRAEEYQAKGFENAKALAGGVAAWKEAGYGAARTGG